MRSACAILCVGLCLTGATVPDQRGPAALTGADADRFARKVDDIVRNGTAAARARHPVETTVTEAELNAFLRLRAQGQLPAGVIEPYVSALGDGRVQGTATVDLDAVRLSRERRWFDPMRLLRGRLPVTATGVLHARAGAARFELEDARAGDVPIPKVILQELVAYYTRGPSYPDGVDVDAPFALPAGIREINVLAGRATIVQ